MCREERIGYAVLIPVWSQGSYFGTEALKNLVLHFLQQYVSRAPGVGRGGLASAQLTLESC